MSSKTINMAALHALKNGKGADAEVPEKATFLADTLHCLITDASGNTVVECEMEPRGFTAKLDKRTNQTRGGLGWYADVKSKDAGEYRGLPVNGGIRVSLDKIKVEPGTTVDLNGDSDSEDSEG